MHDVWFRFRLFFARLTCDEVDKQRRKRDFEHVTRPQAPGAYFAIVFAFRHYYYGVHSYRYRSTALCEVT